MQLKNPNHEMFCQLYASNKEFFGNGVASYVEAYHINLQKKGAYNSARANASILLTNHSILDRIREIMDIEINDLMVDKELAFVIKQDAEFSSKVAAIREYNQLKGRIIKKIEHSGKITLEDFLSDDTDNETRTDQE